MDALWNFLNSPLFLTLASIALAYGLGKLLTAKPEWEKWKGPIIEAIKFAEKNIPDDTANVSARRLDAALKYVIQAYTIAMDRPIPQTLMDAIRQAIPIVHAELEKNGNLNTTIIIEPAKPVEDKPTVSTNSPLWLIPLMLASMFLGGCGQTPAQQLMSVRDSLATGLEATVILYDAGKIDKEQLSLIYEIGRSARAACDRAEAANQLGNTGDFTYYLSLARAAVQEFLAMRIAAERETAKKGKPDGTVPTSLDVTRFRREAA